MNYALNLFFLLIRIDSFDLLLHFALKLVHLIFSLFALHYIVFRFFWIEFSFDLKVVFELSFILSEFSGKFTVNLLETRLGPLLAEAGVGYHVVVHSEFLIECQREFTALISLFLLLLPPQYLLLESLGSFFGVLGQQSFEV